MDAPGEQLHSDKIANEGAAEYYSKGNFRGETKTSERLKVKQNRNNTSKNAVITLVWSVIQVKMF